MGSGTVLAMLDEHPSCSRPQSSVTASEDLAALLQAKLANPPLSKADWVALETFGRT
jgi:hypothetical protein